MFSIIGIVLLFGMVFGSYLISGGKIGVILRPCRIEMMTIGGAAIAALPDLQLDDRDQGHVRRLRPRSSPARSGRPPTTATCSALLFLLTKTMKSKGVIALESHIEKPEESTIFSRFPKILKDHFAVDFICDTLRMMTMNLEDPHQVEDAMEKQLEKHHHEALAPADALQSHGRRPAGAGHRRRRARRHQDHGRRSPSRRRSWAR